MSIITALPTFRQSGAESATMKQRSQGYIQYPYHVDSTKHVYLSISCVSSHPGSFEYYSHRKNLRVLLPTSRTAAGLRIKSKIEFQFSCFDQNMKI